MVADDDSSDQLTIVLVKSHQFFCERELIYLRMKIKEAKPGILTNYEVLEHLRSRGATTNPLSSLGSATRSECKAFEYLMQTPAASQTRENVEEFLKISEEFKLTSAEKVQIINLSPTSQVELFVVVEEMDKRLTEEKQEELLRLSTELLQPTNDKEQQQ